MADEIVASKPFWASKTLWANVLLGAGVILNQSLGFNLDGSEQAAIIIVVNIILRAISKGKITIS